MTERRNGISCFSRSVPSGSYLVSVRQTCVSRVLPPPEGSSRYKQQWTCVWMPSCGKSRCSVDMEDRYVRPEDGSACQVLTGSEQEVVVVVIDLYLTSLRQGYNNPVQIYSRLSFQIINQKMIYFLVIYFSSLLIIIQRRKKECWNTQRNPHSRAVCLKGRYNMVIATKWSGL